MNTFLHFGLACLGVALWFHVCPVVDAAFSGRACVTFALLALVFVLLQLHTNQHLK